MTEPLILFQKKGAVGVITLNRPEFKNEITPELASQLKEVRQEVDWDSDLNVIVLTGQGGDFFCNGTDSASLETFTNRKDLLAAVSAAQVMGSFDRPTIAAVNGLANGQGLELALACDLRLASSEAVFSMTQILSADLPFDGGTQRLARLVGRAKALEMILLGQSVTSDEALEIGLVNKVLPPEELMDKVMETAQSMAKSGPVALRLAKEAVHEGMDMSLRQGLRLEADLYFLIHTTEDRTEGITAFKGKRRPEFSGK